MQWDWVLSDLTDVGVLLALLSSSALEMLYCCECFAAVLLAIMV